MSGVRRLELKHFAPDGGYRLLPIRFERLEGELYVVTNDVGEFVRLDRASLDDLVNHRLDPRSEVYRALKARHMLYDRADAVALDLLALKCRTRTEPLAAFTGLHLFVVTLRCDHSCGYCQVSRRTEDRAGFDMSVEHADRALEHVFRSPNPKIKIEFQGGEPLLNLPLVVHIAERARARASSEGRDLALVLASNLSRLDDDALALCRRLGIALSTSLDGPAELHDRQRPRPGGGSHAATVKAIRRAREVLGHDAVAALMTTTVDALDRVEDIVDEYARLGFASIFLRSQSPYGFAARSLTRRYDAEVWVRFYERGLAHILRLNAQGVPMREEYTTILLQKMFSPFGSAYVDLQSPAGAGIGALVYNYDGSVFASDEGRMLAEMGDLRLRLGHVNDDYAALLGGDTLALLLDETLLESAPGCSDCGFLPYCGADPAHHLATQRDALGHKAFSDFCARQKGVLRHLLTVFEDDAQARETMLGWLACS